MSETLGETEEDYGTMSSETLSTILDDYVARMKNPKLDDRVRQDLERRASEIMYILADRGV